MHQIESGSASPLDALIVRFIAVVALALAAVHAGPVKAARSYADFNDDGKSDLVWRDASTGRTAIWLMDGLGATSSAIIWSDGNWEVTHVGDFNGDGKSDLVWRNSSTGQTALWLMNGTSATAANIVMTYAEWRVTHVGDFNGDGKPDLVWRSASTGTTAIWLMDGLGATSSAIIWSDGNWEVTHVGDFDGDRKSDLVWRDDSTGRTAIWLMDGLGATSSAIIWSDWNWYVTHIGDFSGDGKDDLVWRYEYYYSCYYYCYHYYDYSQISQAIWLMDGLAASAASMIYNEYGSSYCYYVTEWWEVTHAGDFNGDRKTDLVWQNVEFCGLNYSLEKSIWLMNGTAAVSSAIVMPDRWWVVVPAELGY